LLTNNNLHKSISVAYFCRVFIIVTFLLIHKYLKVSKIEKVEKIFLLLFGEKKECEMTLQSL